MPDDVHSTALRERQSGKARTGAVTLRDFDQGVVETLGAKVIEDRYIITGVPNVDAPPGLAGVPVVFAHPEEVFQTHKIPVIEVRRDDVSPAMNRWHPGTIHYRVPAQGAQKVAAAIPGTGMVTGYDSYEEQQQACPFDLLYSINIIAKNRQYMASAQQLLAYVLKIYQPYCGVWVKDSVGDWRSYEAFLESVAPMDEAADVAERVIGFALSLRVEAELDLNEPFKSKAITKLPTLRTKSL